MQTPLMEKQLAFQQEFKKDEPFRHFQEEEALQEEEHKDEEEEEDDEEEEHDDDEEEEDDDQEEEETVMYQTPKRLDEEEGKQKTPGSGAPIRVEQPPRKKLTDQEMKELRDHSAKVMESFMHYDAN